MLQLANCWDSCITVFGGLFGEYKTVMGKVAPEKEYCAVKTEFKSFLIFSLFEIQLSILIEVPFS